MKALQKNQGRTDQMLGAMADMLTSVAMPKQQWLSEGVEADLPSSEEEKGPVQGQWEPEGLEWEQQATATEKPERRDRTAQAYLRLEHSEQQSQRLGASSAASRARFTETQRGREAGETKLIQDEI
ncbi:hypothetical protein EYF80_007287 [Liparis tanakae]|uniref:Uncharacterized protein n=1 Tax=Liparis tanakae TaxID=230148 RepID=A0A4Z2IYS5_9TELE|nr:hypothetical protein EYF80_007287 [Liparis tanakae]